MIEAAIRDAVAQAIAPLADELQRLREALEQRGGGQADEVGDTGTAAGWLGMSVPAFKAAAHRHADLAALAMRVGRSRRWRRADLLRWAESQRASRAPRLRVVKAGRP